MRYQLYPRGRAMRERGLNGVKGGWRGRIACSQNIHKSKERGIPIIVNLFDVLLNTLRGGGLPRPPRIYFRIRTLKIYTRFHTWLYDSSGEGTLGLLHKISHFVKDYGIQLNPNNFSQLQNCWSPLHHFLWCLIYLFINLLRLVFTIFLIIYPILWPEFFFISHVFTHDDEGLEVSIFKFMTGDFSFLERLCYEDILNKSQFILNCFTTITITYMYIFSHLINSILYN